MIEKINDLYKELLSKYEGGISNTSTSKFNDIKALFRSKYGLSEDDIYADQEILKLDYLREFKRQNILYFVWRF